MVTKTRTQTLEHHVRYHNHSVTLGSQRSGLQQRLGVLYTLAVHVESCLDVVQRIRDEILTVPKLVVEDVLCGWHDLDFLRIDLDVGIVPVFERWCQSFRDIRRA